MSDIVAKKGQKKNSTGKHDKGCAKLIGAGMQLKDDAAAFVESIKEDAEDIKAEAAYNKSEAVKAFLCVRLCLFRCWFQCRQN